MDSRPILQPYYGGSVNGVFHCPLEPQEVANLDLDESLIIDGRNDAAGYRRLNGSMYNIYSGEFSTHNGSNYEWSMDHANRRYMKMQGMRFRGNINRNGNNQRDYNVLVSDFTNRGKGSTTSTVTAHPATNGASTYWQESEQYVGWLTNPLEGLADANFATDDGAVKTYSTVHHTMDDFDQIGSSSRRLSVLVPSEDGQDVQ